MTIYKFMDVVYSELQSDCDNYRANRIIDAADAFAEESILSTINRVLEIIDKTKNLCYIKGFTDRDEALYLSAIDGYAVMLRREILALKGGDKE